MTSHPFIAIAAAAAAMIPASAQATDMPSPGSPGCHGRALASGLHVAHDAGRHGLPQTFGGDIDSIADVKALIHEYCTSP